MKVPAECPGEQSKEDKKKLKANRQEQAQGTPTVTEPSPSNGDADSPALGRRDTMNSLSSGYAASAHRSVAGSAASIKPSIEESSESAAVTPKPAASTTSRRHRVLAPPPTQYGSGPPAAEPVSTSNDPKGKMLYAYQANGDGEITVEEGQGITILDPDGKENRLLNI